MGSNSLAISTGLRLPNPRVSGGNGISSRPQTPTFLPVPSGNLQASTSATSLKRSTGPNAPNTYNSQLKRSSFGNGNGLPLAPRLLEARRRTGGTKYRRGDGYDWRRFGFGLLYGEDLRGRFKVSSVGSHSTDSQILSPAVQSP